MLYWGLLERIILAAVKVDEGGFCFGDEYSMNCGTNCGLVFFFLVGMSSKLLDQANKFASVTHVTFF